MLGYVVLLLVSGYVLRNALVERMNDAFSYAVNVIEFLATITSC